MEVEDDVDEPAPPTASVKEEAEAPKENGICRERKLVDKVFKDEKGFIGNNSRALHLIDPADQVFSSVTKKTWVTTETKTEPVEKKEDVEVVKKDEKNEEKTAAASAPAKKKQADIMSFFSRK